MKNFKQVYEPAVWTKRLHKTFSKSHSSEKLVKPVYKQQESCKITYN